MVALFHPVFIRGQRADDALYGRHGIAPKRSMSRNGTDAQGRLDHGPPIAVVDIGSE